MQKSRVNVIIDGQWGGTGKGKLAGYLARRNDLGAVVYNPSLVSCHTYMDDDYNRREFCMLPAGAINEDALIVITPDSYLHKESFLLEVEGLNCASRLRIHPATRVRDGAWYVSAAKDIPALAPYTADTSKVLRGLLSVGRTVLVESAGAFGLGSYWGTGPCVRDVTVGSILDSLGLPPAVLGDVYGCLKTYPTRVSDEERGPYYSDQHQMTWQEVNQLAGDTKIVEYQQRTAAMRFVHTFSILQLQRFMRICAPQRLFLNCVNYWDKTVLGCRLWDELPPTVQWRVRQLSLVLEDCARAIGCYPQARIALLGTGPRDSDMIEVNE